MQNYQLPENELGELFNRFIPVVKKNKFKTLIITFLFLFYFSFPGLQIPILEYNSFRITSLMEQRAFEHYMLFYPRQSWVDIDDVKPALLKAIISMEDGKFFTHKGIDWVELGRSMRTNKRRGRSVRGASTMTMQLAKNLFLTTDKSIIRKAKELLITFRMEKELSKKAILENYINAVEWGDGIFGIKEASENYFNKEPSALTVNEASRLAAVIPSPLRFAPNKNTNYVLRRAGIIRGRLNDVVLDF
ncbi:MAG: monofunctional biosynthetic peptidoglycan transglycosylase [Ignavibacteriaceae bacterium]|nr:monofunctional biosynthetic peptidoglycan transglycosylase [Ignavibacteriaceae bacterium]